jgi:hypothetical protein
MDDGGDIGSPGLPNVTGSPCRPSAPRQTTQPDTCMHGPHIPSHQCAFSFYLYGALHVVSIFMWIQKLS